MAKRKSVPRSGAGGGTSSRRASARAAVPKTVEAKSYRHTGTDAPMRPDAGTQAQFRKKKPPKTYRYDSSLSPALDFDGQNSAREQGERIIREILEAPDLERAKDAATRLKALGRPFLNWTGKAERLSFNVPTLPLFVHERLSTKAILETLKGHRKSADREQMDLFNLFSDPQRPITDQILRAYEHRDEWVNRIILGDSLVVMNSLLEYEGMGGQVQMIYMDPPYGVKFGSNFQPFIRKREVSHGDDADMTREPEMVQAYRDTWELGLHSYLTYMRDRLYLAKDLLHPTGSIFVQISDENLHHVRELMDETFGPDHFVGVVTFAKTSGQSSPQAKTEVLASTNDFLLWYARDKERVKYRQIFSHKSAGASTEAAYAYVELSDGTRRAMTSEEQAGEVSIPTGSRVFTRSDLTAQKPTTVFDFKFEGKTYNPLPRGWRTTEEGMVRLATQNRLTVIGNTLRYVQYFEDFPVSPINNLWDDTGVAGFTADKLYVVQTNAKVIQRCISMTTDPGDLVLDPTCGSGTTAYVAEQWGRRWITIDTSRVPLALARQRLLTATFDYYELQDEARGPGAGFVYKRKQNNKGEEVGGIVPHVTLKSIANNEPPQEEVLVDRPEKIPAVVRVSGPFAFEAMIPRPGDWDEVEGGEVAAVSADERVAYLDRMVEVLRRSPIIRLPGNRTVNFKRVRPIAKSLSLSAEAVVEATAPGQKPTLEDAIQEAEEQNRGELPLSQRPVALVFGPENGAVSEKLVFEAAKEANGRNYTHLYVLGFGIQPNARNLIEHCEEAMQIPATYVEATPDLMMGDLLKNMRSSQIFTVCGLPEVAVRPAKSKEGERWQAELLGLDVFDPVTMEVEHESGENVPAWFLDTDYNGLCFHVCQAFFPKTGAWEGIKKAIKGDFEESVWDHLAGTTSAPFEPGEHRTIAVKVINERGNELMVVKKLGEV